MDACTKGKGLHTTGALTRGLLGAGHWECSSSWGEEALGWRGRFLLGGGGGRRQGAVGSCLFGRRGFMGVFGSGDLARRGWHVPIKRVAGRADPAIGKSDCWFLDLLPLVALARRHVAGSF